MLHKESALVLQQPDIIARLSADGALPVGNAPAVFAQEIRDDIVRWAKVIKTANITVQMN